MGFYGGLFSRLPREIRQAEPLTRYVGYQSPRPDGSCLHFLGLEVLRGTAIPPGMLAWQFRESNLRVWQGDEGQERLAWEHTVRWTWREMSPCPTGEFVAPCPLGVPGEFAFYQCANAYVKLGESEACSDEVEIRDYDPSWPGQFEQFAGWLARQIGGEMALRIEHFGSTAIPGMPAKPIVDVLLEVPSVSEAKPVLLPLLNTPRWEYWWYDEHMVFVRRERLIGMRTHHLHVVPSGSRFLERLAFRDYLRSHPETANEYAALKRRLAAAHRTDRERYTLAKGEFVRGVTEKALRDM
jgi:GrpB-like predicted nucleotidyltransferase (UPF0157 family)